MGTLLPIGRGLHSEAVKTYEECLRSLQDYLGVEPDPLTTALYKKIKS